jgi:uncharacterized repeat protein (TIGR03803 family)
LYGTTSEGGGECNGFGCGTVFSLDPATGAETVVYSFCTQPYCGDGAYPASGLLDMNGALYGTTEEGGTYAYGAVFAITP